MICCQAIFLLGTALPLVTRRNCIQQVAPITTNQSKQTSSNTLQKEKKIINQKIVLEEPFLLRQVQKHSYGQQKNLKHDLSQNLNLRFLKHPLHRQKPSENDGKTCMADKFN